MSKLAFLLCVAVVAKVNGAMVKPPGVKISLAKVILDDVTNVKISTTTSNIDVEQESSFELIEKIIDNKAKFSNEYQKHLAAAEDVVKTQEAHIFALAEGLTAELKGILAEANVTAVKYYKEQAAEECSHFIEELNEELARLKRRAFSLSMAEIVSAKVHLHSATTRYEDTVEVLSNLQSVADTCVGQQCTEIERIANDLVSENQLQKIREDLRNYSRKTRVNNQNAPKVFNAQQVTRDYEKKVDEGFENFISCFVSKKE